MKEFHTYTLPNGIRGIHRQVRGNVAHCDSSWAPARATS